MDTEVDYDEEDTGRDAKRARKFMLKGRGHKERLDDSCQNFPPLHVQRLLFQI